MSNEEDRNKFEPTDRDDRPSVSSLVKEAHEALGMGENFFGSKVLALIGHLVSEIERLNDRIDTFEVGRSGFGDS